MDLSNWLNDLRRAAAFAGICCTLVHVPAWAQDGGSVSPAPNSPAPNSPTTNSQPANSQTIDSQSGNSPPTNSRPVPATPAADNAQTAEAWWSFHVQATTITQAHDAFKAPYSGSESLQRKEPWRTTETMTVFLGARVWPGGEIYIDPEAAGGRGLSGAVGLAGFPNGEATRVGSSQLTPYLARLFFRQTFALSDVTDPVEGDLNQIAERRARSNVVLTVGKLAAGDVFDGNQSSHDPRTQFENWSLMANGAWDYPADTRGYTYGATVEWNCVDWSARAGAFAEPTEANGARFDHHLSRAFGDVVEIERRYKVGEHAGAVRALVFANSAHMGNYRDALLLESLAAPSVAAAPDSTTPPDITATRRYRVKYGAGLNFEQSLTAGISIFGRAGWNDGHTETWAFTEIDNTVSFGVTLSGASWHRRDDVIGVAVVSNGLSASHREYLAAGGHGFIVGDGRLDYAREDILETYYSWAAVRGVTVSVDGQFFEHPAYNRDRGPVALAGVRMHLQW